MLHPTQSMSFRRRSPVGDNVKVGLGTYLVARGSICVELKMIHNNLTFLM